MMNCQASLKILSPPIACFFAPGLIGAAAFPLGLRHA